MGYAVTTFLVVFLLLASSLVLLLYREALAQRLSGVIGRRGGPGLLERLKLRPAGASAAAESIRRIAPGESAGGSVIRKRLLLAGYRRDAHARMFSLSKLMVPVVLCALVAVTGLYRWNAFLVFVGSLGIGYLLPDYWLDHRIKKREAAIQRGLPDLLDLIVVCLEAGLSIDQAAIRSSEEMSTSHPAIAEELSLVMLEVRAGQTRLEAWKHLLDRTNLDAIRMLVTILVQADQFGTGISRTLRTHSETIRIQRKRKAEEMAAKTSVKLVIPLVLFVFPSFFVVVIGPAVIRLVEVFGKP